MRTLIAVFKKILLGNYIFHLVMMLLSVGDVASQEDAIIIETELFNSYLTLIFYFDQLAVVVLHVCRHIKF